MQLTNICNGWKTAAGLIHDLQRQKRLGRGVLDLNALKVVKLTL
jgi:predicted phage gp36 major capsid-like protein